MRTVEEPVLERLLDPLARILTPEVARKLGRVDINQGKLLKPRKMELAGGRLSPSSRPLKFSQCPKFHAFTAVSVNAGSLGTPTME